MRTCMPTPICYLTKGKGTPAILCCFALVCMRNESKRRETQSVSRRFLVSRGYLCNSRIRTFVFYLTIVHQIC